MQKELILKNLPYSKPFLFVDDILEIDDSSIKGIYTFPVESYFYKGHFKNNPVTPGVILTECMAQIGLVCFGMYLSEDSDLTDVKIAMTHTETEFLKPVFPGEKVTVISNKIYFRFNKLKCKVTMMGENSEKICYGTISGMILNSSEG